MSIVCSAPYVYVVNEPVAPLLLSRRSNLFKLFMNDVGLLSAMYMDGIQLKILNSEIDVNFGAVYENVVARGEAAFAKALKQ